MADDGWKFYKDGEEVKDENDGYIFLGSSNAGDQSLVIEGGKDMTYNFIPCEGTVTIGDGIIYEPKELTSCPDCKGSGKYIGFNKVENCLNCEGKGVC